MKVLCLRYLALSVFLLKRTTSLQFDAVHKKTSRRHFVLHRLHVGHPVEVQVDVRDDTKSATRRRCHEANFDTMVARFLESRPVDLDVDNPRIRVLLHSVRGTLQQDKAVVRAFKILYADILPVRIAGDLIFRKLDNEIIKSSENLQEDPEVLDECVLRWGEQEVVNAERIFRAIDRDRSGDITPDELMKSEAFFRSINQNSGDETFDQEILNFMSEVDLENKLTEDYPKSLGFAEFMERAASLDPLSFCRDSTDTDRIVDAILANEDVSMRQHDSLDSKEGKKFNAMCAEFVLWENTSMLQRAKDRDPRLAEVLVGCFSGARNQTVLRALKILYEDYRPLRLGGDLIFKVMKNLVQ